MDDNLAGNAAARDAILARVRRALGRDGPSVDAMRAAEATITAHVQGPRPAMPAALAARFIERATDMASTVERIDAPEDVPHAVARYIDGLALPEAIESQRSRRGVCWPELALLDWRSAGLEIVPRPATGDDRLAITGAFCAIAETGTLVFATAPDTPTGAIMLPDTHVAVLRADRIVSGMEEAFALVREERATMPRAIHMVSGPSRTGDIEQTIVLGAHGPYRMHVLVLG